ncbi:MAG TPA: Vms1/Ankzf1 family peptidyl-tRNA hydrolase [Acidimicrobiales bacterium]|nr:Vms1/Ankzf1 family peptidyl-tRNA hydrolase [Acidimicrobiales bacterium]
MESSGGIPAGGADLSDLVGLAAERGPFATLYMATEAGIDNAAQRSELRWRGLRDHLVSDGAPQSVLEAIDAVVPDAHLRGESLAVVADADGVRLSESFSQPPATDLARWATLPSLVPLIEWRQMSPAHILALVDRQGADLVLFRPRRANVVEVAGDGWPVHAPHAGGWSERRYQATIEENWKHNAARVAEEVTQLVKTSGARVIAVAGDVRARQLLLEALPTAVADRCVPIDGGRGPDGSEDEVAAETLRQVATVVAADTKGALAAFKQERGEGGRAADGPAATMAALAAGQVGLLLVSDDSGNDAPTSRRGAWFGEQGNQVGLDRATVEAMGAESPAEARLVDVAVRAALQTGAEVRVVPQHGGPRDGLGAILRWS